jgi:hypothetical protein
MRTSLNEIKQTDDFLSGKLSPEDSVLFKARLLINPVLRLNVSLHRKTLTLVRFYGRKKLRAEIETVHNKIFQDPGRSSYHDMISKLFKNFKR